MKKFWNFIIKPLIEKSQPKQIVHIGIEEHYLIDNILTDYCNKKGTKLTLIDPSPVVSKYNPNLEVFWNNSLRSIPKLGKFDMILVDGDPNWYTVYNELKLIEQNMLEKSSSPIILIHNTYWPYARRDQYTYPDNIPVKYRKEYKKQGVFPGIAELTPLGLHYPKNHAVSIGDEKNGVLTAIEDFLEQTSIDFTISKLNCMQGLGILLETSNKLLKAVNEILSKSAMKLAYERSKEIAI